MGRTARTVVVLTVLALVTAVAPTSEGQAADGVRRSVAHRAPEGLVVRPLFEDAEATLLVPADSPRQGLTAVWTPDGTAVLYADADGIHAVAADGTGTTRTVVPDAGVGTFDVSPDGRLVAYERREEDGSAIVIAPLGGGGPPQQVTAPGPDARDLDPRWAPDGQAIAFRRFDRPQGRHDLRVIELSAADAQAPATERVLLDRQTWTTTQAPDWTPDGRHLVVNAVLLGGSGMHEVVRVGRDGTDVEVLIGGESVEEPAAVSPDGRFIAWSRQDGPGAQGVWLLDLVTGERRAQVDVEGIERGLAWTADAGTIVFEAYLQDSGCHCDVASLHLVGVGEGWVPVEIADRLLGPIAPAVSPGVAVRTSGPTRVETAVAVSQAAFDAAGAVVLARADAYADALAGGPLAGALGGPVLLSPRDGLPPAVAEEIRRLGARRVVLLGDETALGTAVAADLDAMVDAGDLDAVERIGGTTRFDTAARVARRLDADHGYVVQGAAADPARGWPDAVAVAGLAATEAAPLLLVEHDRLPAETAAAITDGGLTAVTIVGGATAVSPEVERQLRELGVTVDRLEGTNRYETSVAVADRARERDHDVQRVWFATGRDWPDSLAAGPAVARTGGVLFLLDGRDPGGSNAVLVALERTPVRRAWLVGGPDVLTPAAAVAVERRATG